MHGNTAGSFVESSQQPYDLILTTLAENMKTPCAVFAAAPGKKNAPHMQLADGSVFASILLVYITAKVPHPNVVPFDVRVGILTLGKERFESGHAVLPTTDQGLSS
jgi:hypothetical protein